MGLRAGLDERKISPPPGFDFRTVQPVVQSLYRLSYPVHFVVNFLYFILQRRQYLIVIQGRTGRTVNERCTEENIEVSICVLSVELIWSFSQRFKQSKAGACDDLNIPTLQGC